MRRNLPPVCQHLHSFYISGRTTASHTYMQLSFLRALVCCPFPNQGEVKIFSVQLLSPDSLGHTLVAYMPSQS